MTTSKVTDSSFESDVLDASGPVLVDFWRRSGAVPANRSVPRSKRSPWITAAS